MLAAHIPGTENGKADFLSRGNSFPNEWMLHKEVFQKICMTAPVCVQIDHFASSLNAQLPMFCSRGRVEHGLFGFLLFSMIPKVLEKVAREEVNLLSVAPFWPRRSWFPVLPKLWGGGILRG